MKITKKALSVLLAFTLVIGLFLAPTEVAKAATMYGAVPEKIRIYTSTTSQYIRFDLPSYGCTIANVKSSSNKLKAKQTSYYTDLYQDDEGSSSDNYATISVYTQKEGTYKVSFDILDASGAKVSSPVVSVYARNDSPLTSLKLGKNTLKFETNPSGKTTTSNSNNYLLKGKSGKVQVKMAKGYKLTKIEYGIYDQAKDETVYTVVNNKGVVTYGTAIDENSSTYNYERQYDTYTYINKYTRWNKLATAYTDIRVTYIDKYTKAEATKTYPFFQWVD